MVKQFYYACARNNFRVSSPDSVLCKYSFYSRQACVALDQAMPFVAVEGSLVVEGSEVNPMALHQADTRPLGGTLRDRIFRPANHQLETVITTDRGLVIILILDLGESLTMQQRQSMEILAVDSCGSTQATINDIVEAETIPDSIWESGHSYRIGISIPSRPLLDEMFALIVSFDEFRFGINTSLHRPTYVLESGSSTESTASSFPDNIIDHSSEDESD